jgi:2-polyprenyl-3-methyl-5-hydroxy-6-metoxy-1,4-benzoquinol methylase
MDDPDCDLALLHRTYGHFRWVNGVVSGWHRIYRQHLRPLLAERGPTSLLDIGSGAGDIPRALARWAARDGLALTVTAIDPDPRAHAYASTLPAVPGVTFGQATSSQLVASGARFDVVTSNHLLHHLDPQALRSLLDDSARLASRLVLHNDIERSRGAYLAYAVATRPVRSRSFVHVDGLLSIRRSYRRAELAAATDDSWVATKQFPARLLLMRQQA